MRTTFLQSLLSSTQPAVYPRELPQEPGSVALLYKSCYIALDLREDFAYVVRLYLPQRLAGKGHGTVALKWLCHLADKYNVKLILHAAPFTACKLTRKQLRAWYVKHGFQPCGNYLARAPK